MKRFFILMASALCCTSIAFAQFANTKSAGTGVGGPIEGWNGLRVSYGFSSTELKVEEDGISASKTYDFSEISVAYSKGFAISQSAPMFLEVAPEFTMITGSDKEDGTDIKPTFMSIGVPVNFGYRFDLTDEIALMPYAGLTARINIVEKVKGEEKYEGVKVSEEKDFFKDDNGGKRFQLGWQVGAGLNFNKYYVGLGYYADILPAVKVEEDDFETTFSNSSIRLTFGINF